MCIKQAFAYEVFDSGITWSLVACWFKMSLEIDKTYKAVHPDSYILVISVPDIFVKHTSFFKHLPKHQKSKTEMQH